MQQIDDALAVLTNPGFVVPPVPAAQSGVAWLRANVGRFATGEVHRRRRAAQVAVLETITPESLRDRGSAHPVESLAHAMGVHEPVVDLVTEIAQAYQPGTGDESRADKAIPALVAALGGAFDEATAARIGILVQACDATATLIERSRHRPIAEVLRDDPPVPATKRQALAATTIAGVSVEEGEIVRVRLAGDHAFGAGERRCPARAHALALVDGALTAGAGRADAGNRPDRRTTHAW